MQRGTSPVIGVVLLLAITVLSAAAVGLVVSNSPPEPPPTAAFDGTVDPVVDRITLTHVGGDTIDLTTVSVRITVDGDPLAHQPPVPFFAAKGFRSGPTGPFNTASPDRWRAGQTASFRLAATNDPADISPGDTVRIRILTRQWTVAEITATA